MNMVAEFINGVDPPRTPALRGEPELLQMIDAFLASLTPQEHFSLMGDYLEPYTVMLAFSEKPATRAEDVCDNGTGSLIDTGTAKLLVTNHHVYDHLRDLRFKNPESRLMMSGSHGVNYLDISEAEVVGLDDQGIWPCSTSRSRTRRPG